MEWPVVDICMVCMAFSNLIRFSYYYFIVVYYRTQNHSLSGSMHAMNKILCLTLLCFPRLQPSFCLKHRLPEIFQWCKDMFAMSTALRFCSLELRYVSWRVLSRNELCHAPNSNQQLSGDIFESHTFILQYEKVPASHASLGLIWSSLLNYDYQYFVPHAQITFWDPISYYVTYFLFVFVFFCSTLFCPDDKPSKFVVLSSLINCSFLQSSTQSTTTVNLKLSASSVFQTFRRENLSKTVTGTLQPCLAGRCKIHWLSIHWHSSIYWFTFTMYISIHERNSLRSKNIFMS